MRQIIINSLLAGLISGILAHHGVTLPTPDFWIVLTCILAIVINSKID